MNKKHRPQAAKKYVPQERYGNTGHGTHADRRTKRLKTRAAQERAARKEYGY